MHLEWIMAGLVIAFSEDKNRRIKVALCIGNWIWISGTELS